MQEFFIAAWRAEFANYPLLILQAAALLGILSIALLLSRTPTERFESRTLLYGCIFGATSFSLIALASQFFNLPSSPIFRPICSSWEAFWADGKEGPSRWQ